MQISTKDLRDDVKGTLDGHGFRVICASNRPDGSRPITLGRDRFGDYLRFELQDGDVSANERALYGAKPAPGRAMIAFEGDGLKTRIGKPLEMRFKVLVEPGGKLSNPNLFTLIAQWNTYPDDHKTLHSPPLELGLTYTERKTKRASDGKEIVLRDAIGAPVIDERMYFKVHGLKDGAQAMPHSVQSTPVLRGRLYDVRLRFADGGGKDGFAEFVLDGVRQGRYDGPIGFPGNSGPYAGIGLYRHPGQRGSMAVRLYGFTERVTA